MFGLYRRVKRLEKAEEDRKEIELQHNRYLRLIDTLDRIKGEFRSHAADYLHVFKNDQIIVSIEDAYISCVRVSIEDIDSIFCKNFTIDTEYLESLLSYLMKRTIK